MIVVVEVTLTVDPEGVRQPLFVEVLLASKRVEEGVALRVAVVRARRRDLCLRCARR